LDNLKLYVQNLDIQMIWVP